MASCIDGLRLRKIMGRDQWRAPEPYGPDGWLMISADSAGAGRGERESVLVSALPVDGRIMIHASMTRAGDVPSYQDLVLLHQAIWQDPRWPAGHAYLCFLPPAEHVNIHPRALHLWGWRDGGRMVPDMARILDIGGSQVRTI